MSSGSETKPPSQIHHRFTSDLLDIYPPAGKNNFSKRRVFRVLSDVLFDLNLRTGDVIEMTSPAPDYTPEPYAIVAVSFIWSGVLLLHSYPRGCLLRTVAKGVFRTCTSGGPSKSLHNLNPAQVKVMKAHNFMAIAPFGNLSCSISCLFSRNR